MVSRQKLLAAAARIYGESGFRGATTRRIADEAGVNEVTLFRLFGSKSALLAEALREHAPRPLEPPSLPEHPADPERELSAWCEAQLAHLREARSIIRKAMGEIEEHPEMTTCMSEGPTCAFHELSGYARRLTRGAATVPAREAHSAAAMLMGALFAEAMGRELLPTLYPHPEAESAALYAKLFLRAIGYTPARRGRATRGASRPRARGNAPRR